MALCYSDNEWLKPFMVFRDLNDDKNPGKQTSNKKITQKSVEKKSKKNSANKWIYS